MMSPPVFDSCDFKSRLMISKKWILPYEGAFSILSKIAWANLLNCNDLLKALQLRSACQYKHQPRSFLSFNWHSSTSTKNLNDELFREGCLSAYTKRWAGNLADDQHLRFCPKCLYYGYQSPFQQIEGIIRCPIHNESLVKNCVVCNEPSPPYAFVSESYIHPFHCNYCGSPLAGEFDPKMFFEGSSISDMALASFSPVAAWLRKLDASAYQWPSHGNQPKKWFSPYGLTNLDWEPEQLQVFDISRRLVLLNLDSYLLSHQISFARVMEVERRQSQIFSAIVLELNLDEPIRQCKAIYKSIKRYLYKHYVHRHRHCISGVKQAIGAGWCSGKPAVEFLAPACPIVSAFILWRLRAEESNWVLDETMVSDKSHYKWALRDAVYNIGLFADNKLYGREYFDSVQWSWGLLNSFYSCLVILTGVMRNVRRQELIVDQKEKRATKYENAYEHSPYLVLRGSSEDSETFCLTPNSHPIDQTFTFLCPDPVQIVQLLESQVENQSCCCIKYIQRTLKN